MLEAISKNIWLLLTLLVPGLFTYGTWRVLLLLEPSVHLEISALNQIDGSAFASGSIVIAIALLQQVIAIAIESVLALLARSNKENWPNFYSLFSERFVLSAAGKLDDNSTRIIATFFLSINISVGLSLLLLYFLAYENMNINQWIPLAIIILLVSTLIATIFRMFNAKWVVKECKESL